MTTLVLQAVGSTVGSVAGGPIGAALGRAAGGLVGAAVDGTLFGGSETRHVEGPRLKELDGLASTEGAAIPRVYGRARVGGQLIWATRFEEVVNTNVERSGRSGGKGSASSKTVRTTYAYFANLAVGLCEGPIAFVRRVWADGRELDLAPLTMRVHRGSEDQPPDPLIVAKEGAADAPAYRGTAYVVFERLPLAEFGNRVPQFSFEVVRAVEGLGSMIRAVCLIPGANEFAYDPAPVTQVLGLGATRPENRHQLQAATDISASLDALQALCPSVERVSLVVSWFGDDLRAGSCSIAPRVDRVAKETYGDVWSVAGLDRAAAREVTQANGAAAYGGTPSDAGVIRLIRELKSRGLGVALYLFVMMDVPAGNNRPDPHTGSPGQPPYPWRGRITCDPAPGRPGSPDGTPGAAYQVAAFFGAAAPGDFAAAGDAVAYAGPDEWTFRRLVLHYAHLAAAAGGVDGIILGSELVGLTRVRSAPGVYPAVQELRRLAGDLRTVVGPQTRIVYAADWTEYGAHVIDGGAEVRFPLDPLFADAQIDAVGVDFYPPISDWRDGPDHADLAEARGPSDLAYLQRRLGSGEAFDWYYADPEDRRAQVRTPIADGAYGKPWTYRPKDLVGWWSNLHIERVGGVETTATDWVPRSKPIWLTEIGIPAVDKGPNGPNVFPDPKSSEAAYPPFSHGTRDDLAQARGLEVILARFDPALPGHAAPDNPVSPAYGGPMVDPGHVFTWAWDARPFPSFPDFDLVWADGANWQTGHWITGRIEGAPLDRLVAAVLAEYGLQGFDRPTLDGYLDGYVIDRPMSARQALEPLAQLFGFDAVASGGQLRWRGRGGAVDAVLSRHDLVASDRAPVLKLVRAQETELPRQVEMGFTDGEGEYRRAAVASRRLVGSSRREARVEAAVVTTRPEAQRLADIWLQDAWAARETAEFALSPRAIALEAGDVVTLSTDAGPRLHRVTRIADGPTRQVLTRAVEPAVFTAPATSAPRRRRLPPLTAGRAEVVVLDLPLAREDPPGLAYLAVAADPWPGTMAVWRSADGATFTLHRLLDLPAVIGRTLTSFGPGPLWRLDPVANVDVELSSGSLTSLDDAAALEGRQALAVEGLDGRWEIVSVGRAELVGPRTYRLGRLLRGLGGSEGQAGRVVPPGARVVRLDEAVVPLTSTLDDLGRVWRYRIGPADRDHADPSAVEIAAAASPEVLRPLAPVHVRARRGPNGVTVSFVRRSRRGGDPWDPVEIPLGEEAERYEVDVLDAMQPRLLAATSPAVLYPAADEIADFGGPQSSLRVRVAQVSAAVGRGLARTVSVPVL